MLLRLLAGVGAERGQRRTSSAPVSPLAWSPPVISRAPFSPTTIAPVEPTGPHAGRPRLGRRCRPSDRVAQLPARARSSFEKTLRRCHSTVRGLRNSRVPISAFDSRRGRAGRSGTPGRSGPAPSRHSACGPSRRSPGARSGRARRTASRPIGRACRGRCAAVREHRSVARRDAATRRTGDVRGRPRPAGPRAPGDRSTRGSVVRRRPSSSSAAEPRVDASGPVRPRHLGALGRPLPALLATGPGRPCATPPRPARRSPSSGSRPPVAIEDSLRGASASVVAAKAVVEHGACIVREGDDPPHPPTRLSFARAIRSDATTSCPRRAASSIAA